MIPAQKVGDMVEIEWVQRSFRTVLTPAQAAREPAGRLRGGEPAGANQRTALEPNLTARRG